MAEDTIKYVCGGCCCVALFTLIILIACSFGSIDVNEYGLDYSSISKHVDNKVYSAGIHWIGVGHSFLLYPKTVQTIEFVSERKDIHQSLRSRTQDGLEVTIEISFQYKLISEKMFKLYTAFGLEYENTFVLSAIHILTQTMNLNTAYEFFTERSSIGTVMQQRLNEYFNNYLFATIEFFQLQSVHLPEDFENAIKLSEVKKQDILKAEAEKNKTEIEIQTQILSATLNIESTINLAQGDAEAMILQAKSKSESYKTVQKANAKAYAALKDKLNFSAGDLLDNMKTKILRNYNGSELIVGMKTFESPKSNGN